MLGLEPREQAAASVLTHSHNHFSRILTLESTTPVVKDPMPMLLISSLNHFLSYMLGP